MVGCNFLHFSQAGGCGAQTRLCRARTCSNTQRSAVAILPGRNLWDSACPCRGGLRRVCELRSFRPGRRGRTFGCRDRMRRSKAQRDARDRADRTDKAACCRAGADAARDRTSPQSERGRQCGAARLRHKQQSRHSTQTSRLRKHRQEPASASPHGRRRCSPRHSAQSPSSRACNEKH